MAVDRDKVVQAALKFAEKKRYDKAIAEYQKILQEDPNDPRILLKVAELQTKGEMYPAAIETYEKVGRQYAQQGFAQKAIAVYKQLRELIARHAPQLDERYSHVPSRLAELFQKLGHVADAVAVWEEIALKHQRAGHDLDAADALKKLIELDPNNPLHRLRLAEALSRSRNGEAASEQLRAAADLLIQLGHTDNALKVFERLLQLRPDPATAKRTASLYLDRGQGNDAMLALAKLQIAFQANQKDLETLALLARSFEQLGQPAKAIEVYKELVRLAREQNNRDARKRALERMVQLAPHDEQVRAVLRANPPSSMPAPMPANETPGPESITADAELEVSEAEGDDLYLDDIENLDDASDIELADSSQPGSHPLEIQEPSPPPRAAAIPPPRPAVAPSPVIAPPRPGLPPRPAVIPASPAAPRPAPGEPARPAAAAPRPVAPPPAPTRSQPVAATPAQPARPQLAPLELHLSPHSEGAVAVPSSLRVAEDYGQSLDADVDPEVFTQETLADVMAFRRARQHSRAIECLRIALEVLPDSIALREQLRDVLLEAGDRQNAVGEMITLATIIIDQGDTERAASVLNEVLLLSPDHQRASEMLAGLGFGGLEPVADEGDDLETDLPFDSEPALASGGSLDLDDDPFGDAIAAQRARPARPPSARPTPAAAAPPIGLELDEPDLTPVAAVGTELEPVFDEPVFDDEPRIDDEARLANEPPPAVALSDLDEPVFDEPSFASGPSTDRTSSEPDEASLELEPTRPAPMLATRGFQGGDTVEDALAEVDFFASRGLYEDARSVVIEQLNRLPNHPILLDRLRELDEAMGGAPPPAEPSGPALASGSDLDGALLDALDNFEPTQEAHGHFQQGEEEQVDVESVFAKFKEGVKAQVDDSDSATHYDLGVAYKEMNLLEDAISEFVLAARDPNRTCVCYFMVGTIEKERGNLPKATDAYLQALKAPEKDSEQELSLLYELGDLYQQQGDKKQALDYFKRVHRRDPDYLDVADRIRALEPPKRSPAGRQLDTEEDLDLVFDDILGGKGPF